MTDYRKHPEKYRVGRGEEGVFHVEPYKGELLPLWRFKTAAEAKKSAAAIWKLFKAYRDAGDGVGMDMARKYLQMGFTRSRRYVNRGHPDKAESADIFYAAWQRAARDRAYKAWRAEVR